MVSFPLQLDHRFHCLSSWSLLERIKADPRTASIPVVVLTSSSQEQDMVESYRLGVNSYIRKPVEFTKFSEAIRQFVLYWLLLNEVPSV